MGIRTIAARFGRSVYCHRNVANARVTNELTMPQALGAFTLNETRALMSWLTRQGPFWEDVRIHDSDQYLHRDEEIVTDTAVGEAAYCTLNGLDKRLVSFTPSGWEDSPIAVKWVPEDGIAKQIDIENYVEANGLERVLANAPDPINSWRRLEEIAIARFSNLHFADFAFDSLKGYPFAEGAAQRISVLLNTLNRLKACFDEHGNRTPEGHEIYQDQFTGDKARFSDSSDTEKRIYQDTLTFPHPEKDGDFLFCPMHGKEKSNQLRVHFSSPITLAEPLYVVYIGPKLTKR